EEKPFVIIIPSYNNAKWCIQNIESAAFQNYKNFRVIFIDDCSTDNTYQLVSNYVHQNNLCDKVTLIKNEKRKLACVNIYNTVHTCKDDEICMVLDGDDWFPNHNVLNLLNQVYSQDVWLTYGQFQWHPSGRAGTTIPVPDQVIENREFRRLADTVYQLRTYYAWLYKQIKLKDLLYEGKVMPIAHDVAIMMPMFEMADHRIRFISTPIYVYNMTNPLHDASNTNLILKIDAAIRQSSQYKKFDTPIKTKG
ncbi:unnamed protein product, partial [marine sediment metagenome]